jgi:hypothetical protein
MRSSRYPSLGPSLGRCLLAVYSRSRSRDAPQDESGETTELPTFVQLRPCLTSTPPPLPQLRHASYPLDALAPRKQFPCRSRARLLTTQVRSQLSASVFSSPSRGEVPRQKTRLISHVSLDFAARSRVVGAPDSREKAPRTKEHAVRHPGHSGRFVSGVVLDPSLHSKTVVAFATAEVGRGAQIRLLSNHNHHHHLHVRLIACHRADEGGEGHDSKVQMTIKH